MHQVAPNLGCFHEGFGERTELHIVNSCQNQSCGQNANPQQFNNCNIFSVPSDLLVPAMCDRFTCHLTTEYRFNDMDVGIYSNISCLEPLCPPFFGVGGSPRRFSFWV